MWTASLALAVPAAAAALAYVNAKASIGNDLRLLRAVFKSERTASSRQASQQLNLFYYLEHWAKLPDHANLPLVLFEGKTWTYAQLYDTALRYGHWLKTEMGVKPKQVVAMCYTNTDMFIVTWMALFSIGAVPAFINYLLTGKGLAHCLRISTANLCLVDPLVASSVQAVSGDADGMKFVVATPELREKAFSAPAIREPDEARNTKDPADLAILIYTSGTTGFPKAAVVSWAKIYKITAITGTMLGLQQGETMYSVGYRASCTIMAYTCIVPLLILSQGHASISLNGFTCRPRLKFSGRQHPGPGRQVQQAHILERHS